MTTPDPTLAARLSDMYLAMKDDHTAKVFMLELLKAYCANQIRTLAQVDCQVKATVQAQKDRAALARYESYANPFKDCC